jgi:hypothetical protein
MRIKIGCKVENFVKWVKKNVFFRKNTEGGKKSKRVLYLARYLMWHGLLVPVYQNSKPFMD